MESLNTNKIKLVSFQSKRKKTSNWIFTSVVLLDEDLPFKSGLDVAKNLINKTDYKER